MSTHVLLTKLVDRVEYAGHAAAEVARLRARIDGLDTAHLTRAQARAVWETPLPSTGEWLTYVCDTPSIGSPMWPAKADEVIDTFINAVRRVSA